MADDNQKLYDYMTGAATGAGYNAYSSFGASHATTYTPTPLITSTPTHTIPPYSGGAAPAVPVSPPTKEEIKARKKHFKERIASERDTIFLMFLLAAFVGGAAYVDYKYMPVWEWWAHALFVLVPAALLVALLHKLKLVRFLRRTVATGVLSGVLYFGLVFFEVIPPFSVPG